MKESPEDLTQLSILSFSAWIIEIHHNMSVLSCLVTFRHFLFQIKVTAMNIKLNSATRRGRNISARFPHVLKMVEYITCGRGVKANDERLPGENVRFICLVSLQFWILIDLLDLQLVAPEDDQNREA